MLGSHEMREERPVRAARRRQLRRSIDLGFLQNGGAVKRPPMVVVELRTKAVLVSFGALGRCRLRDAQVQINVVSNFCASFSSQQQLPVVRAGLEVRHGLSTVAFDRGLVVRPCSLYFAVE